VAVQQIVAIVSRATMWSLGKSNNLPYFRTKIPVRACLAAYFHGWTCFQCVCSALSYIAYISMSLSIAHIEK
jgi:hypothetical protein